MTMMNVDPETHVELSIYKVKRGHRSFTSAINELLRKSKSETQ